MRAGCAARWSTLRVFTRVAVDQHAAAQVPTVAAARWRSYLRLEGTYVVARRGEPRLPGRVSCSDALASRVLGFLRRESKTRVVLSWSSAVCVWARDRGSPDSGSRALLAASPIATEPRVVHGPKIVLQHPRQKYVLQEFSLFSGFSDFTHFSNYLDIYFIMIFPRPAARAPAARARPPPRCALAVSCECRVTCVGCAFNKKARIDSYEKSVVCSRCACARHKPLLMLM